MRLGRGVVSDAAGDGAILYLSRRDVGEILGAIDAVAVVRRTLIAHAEGRTLVPTEAYLEWEAPSEGRSRSLAMPGAVEGVVGTKIVNANPCNAAAGLPRADGLTLLFDPETARIRAILAASPISAVRTAAITMIAAEALGAASISTAAVIGAGEIAMAHADLLARALPHLRDVRVFDIDHRRVETLVARLGESSHGRPIRARACGTAEEATRGSLLIVTATTTERGYIPRSWLDPGALLVHVSLDDLLPQAVLDVDRLYVDDWELVRADPRRLVGRMIRAGLIVGPGETPPLGGRSVDGTLGDVLAGRTSGRRREDEVVVVNPFGMAITDVALAAAVVEIAHRQGIGRALRR
jgi:ornithine cyclodeaminase/alanine dehydrogenase-like protein (mu-crystallin family)